MNENQTRGKVAAVQTPKWLKWEFWPFWFFYLPVYGYWLWLSVRARSLTFFTAANPGMAHGGFVNYSKYGPLRDIPSTHRPPTVLLEPPLQVADVEAARQAAGIEYPIILKPDRGERGFAVAKLDSVEAVGPYLATAPGALVLQGYVALPEEFGVLYYRLPGQERGAVYSVVQKEFLAVTGDGQATLHELFRGSARTRYHLPMLENMFKDELTSVLPAGARRELVAIGNHARGTTFLNANHLVSERLAQAFDPVARGITGYHFGRFDVRTASAEALLAGDFQVLEVNGANSEPAHIYDPNYRLLQAYRDLFAHWRTLYTVAQANRKLGAKTTPFWELVRSIRGHLKHKQQHRTG